MRCYSYMYIRIPVPQSCCIIVPINVIGLQRVYLFICWPGVADLHRSYPEDGVEADEQMVGKRPKLDKAGSFDVGMTNGEAEPGSGPLLPVKIGLLIYVTYIKLSYTLVLV